MKFLKISEEPLTNSEVRFWSNIVLLQSVIALVVSAIILMS